MGRPPIDITGKRVGKLVALYRVNIGRRHGHVWMFRCDCGNLTERTTGQFGRRKNPVQDCGNHTYAERTTRRLGTNPTYRSWWGARLRCVDPNNPAYSNYGERGIYMCDRWVESFDNFLDDMGRRPSGMSLDRIDNNGPYSPENCRWATRAEQNNNRRSVILIDVEGRALALKNAAKELGVDYKRLHYLVRTRGLEFSKAVERARELEALRAA